MSRANRGRKQHKRIYENSSMDMKPVEPRFWTTEWQAGSNKAEQKRLDAAKQKQEYRWRK